MSQFMYGVLKPTFGDKVQSAMTDTDSLLCVFTDERMITCMNDERRNKFLNDQGIPVSTDPAEIAAATSKCQSRLAKIATMRLEPQSELILAKIDLETELATKGMNELAIKNEGVRIWQALKAMFPENLGGGKILADYIDMLDTKKLGLFKPDTGAANIISEFVGLRPKCYCMRLEKRNLFTHTGYGMDEIRAKGCDKVAAKKTLKFADYLSVLKAGKAVRLGMKRIRAVKHKIYGYSIEKTALTAHDDKRYICADGEHTHAFGYIAA
jgi:hypothetical protein